MQEIKKRTKIVATVGPACRDPEILEAMVREGVDVFRLNFSHGNHDSHLKNIENIKKIRSKLDCPVAILQDLTGPKIRLGTISEEPLTVSTDDVIILDAGLDGPSRGNRIGVNHPKFAEDVYTGGRLLLADGEIELKITGIEGKQVTCRVVTGGGLYSRKGVNFPTGSFKIPALTDKDIDDLKFGLKNEVDLVAMSFVRTAADLEKAGKIFKETGRSVPLIAKIEKHEAISNLPEIVDAADGIMVARGDLGVEIDLERVPIVQKRIIDMANRAGKPVITATQMLRSMVDSPKPTRAEATDVANAVLDGTDAVMLSEETAVGKFPVRAIRTMVKISMQAEAFFTGYFRAHSEVLEELKSSTTQSVAHSAVILARDLDASLIFAVTRSGYTARAIAKFRPHSLILALTPSESVYYQLSLMWGVKAVKYPLQKDMQSLMKDALNIAEEYGLIKKDEHYVFTSGFPLGEPGSINQITTGLHSE